MQPAARPTLTRGWAATVDDLASIAIGSLGGTTGTLSLGAFLLWLRQRLTAQDKATKAEATKASRRAEHDAVRLEASAAVALLAERVLKLETQVADMIEARHAAELEQAKSDGKLDTQLRLLAQALDALQDAP